MMILQQMIIFATTAVFYFAPAISNFVPRGHKIEVNFAVKTKQNCIFMLAFQLWHCDRHRVPETQLCVLMVTR